MAIRLGEFEFLYIKLAWRSRSPMMLIPTGGAIEAAPTDWQRLNCEGERMRVSLVNSLGDELGATKFVGRTSTKTVAVKQTTIASLLEKRRRNVAE